MSQNAPILFQNQPIRKVWHENKWWFVVTDVVSVLTDSKDASEYVSKLRKRDEELSKGWGQIVHPLLVQTVGGKQKTNCANAKGILRIIQAIPSPKAEPFKMWLAQVGKDRLDEIQDPELALRRMRHIYEQKGYPKNWVDKRIRGIAVRQDLTKEWQNRGIEQSRMYAILTEEIMKETFAVNTAQHKKIKALKKQDNLRDHMTDMELILAMLAEATTTQITRSKDSRGLPSLRRDANEGGRVAGRTRKDIEQKTGQKVVSKSNYKQLKPGKKKLK